MNPSYIVLFGAVGHPSADGSESTEMALRDLGMERRFSTPTTRLYTSQGTPVRRLRNRAIIVGQLFDRDGNPLEEEVDFPVSQPLRVRRHLLENCWGDYLLLQLSDDDDDDWTIMRDPSGGMPCVYSCEQGQGFVTSDVSVAVHLGLYTRRVDWSFIPHFLTYPYVKTQRSGLQGIRELLPGCSMHREASRIATAQEWSPWDFATAEARHTDEVEAANDVRKAVTSVVGAWARYDQSILLELSGGLDSSIVAACLRDTGALVTCCTLVTPVPGADEQRYARLMADYLGTELQSRVLSFEDCKFNFTLPSDLVRPGIAALHYAVNEHFQSVGDLQNVASFFSGGGGDTVFCYFNTATPAVDAFKERGIAAGIAAVRDLSELHQCTFWKAGRLALKKLARGPKAPCKPDRFLLSEKGTADTAEMHPWFGSPARALPGDCERIFDLAGMQTLREGVPRASKRRYRMPLLSQPVMEACIKIPTWMWNVGGRNRAVARDAFSDVLPQAIFQRRSKGTFVSYIGGAYRRNKRLILDFLMTGSLQSNGLLDTEALCRLVEKEPGPRDESFLRLFELCTVENWVRHQA